MPLSTYVLGQRKSLKEKCEYPNEKFGKATCLMSVHQGVNDRMSNESVFDHYNITITAMENQYLFQKHCLENEGMTDALKTLQPPIRYALNKDTLYDCVAAITQTYKNSDDSVYQKIKSSLFWGFSHDAIIKFGVDYLGVFIQATDVENFIPVVAPQQLMQIKGGHTAVDIAENLIRAIAKQLDVTDSAFKFIGNMLEASDESYDSMQLFPAYMKLGKVFKLDVDNKEIHITLQNMPVANTGDGVASNQKAARLLAKCYGIQTLSFWCATHSTDLVLKRMATSKTMCVPEVVTTYESLRPVVKHFELSTKSKAILDEAIEILDLR